MIIMADKRAVGLEYTNPVTQQPDVLRIDGALFDFLSGNDVPKKVREFIRDLYYYSRPRTKEYDSDNWTTESVQDTLASKLILNKEGKVFMDYADVRTSLDQDAVVTFMPHGKVSTVPYPRNEPNPNWGEKCRQSTKIGKWMLATFNQQALCTWGITDAVLERLSASFKAYFDVSKYTIKEITGPEMEPYFCDNSYQDPNAGNLGRACDRYPHFQGKYHFDFFALNRNHCALLVVLDQHGKVAAEAMLWKGVHATPVECVNYGNGNGGIIAQRNKRDTRRGPLNLERIITFVDKVYYGKPHLEGMVHNYARAHGYYALLENQYVASSYNSWSQLRSPYTGEVRYFQMWASTGLTADLQRYPYSDTMAFLSNNLKVVSSYQGRFLLRSTEGGKYIVGKE